MKNAIGRRELFGLGAAALGFRAMAQTASAKLTIDIYSRHLLWLRTAEDVAAAAHEMGYDGVDLMIENVRTDSLHPASGQIPSWTKRAIAWTQTVLRNRRWSCA
jgi:hypothetical protein